MVDRACSGNSERSAPADSHKRFRSFREHCLVIAEEYMTARGRWFSGRRRHEDAGSAHAADLVKRARPAVAAALASARPPRAPPPPPWNSGASHNPSRRRSLAAPVGSTRHCLLNQRPRERDVSFQSAARRVVEVRVRRCQVCGMMHRDRQGWRVADFWVVSPPATAASTAASTASVDRRARLDVTRAENVVLSVACSLLRASTERPILASWWGHARMLLAPRLPTEALCA